jgi:cell wall-associated NlpC family hydrolase
VSASTRPDAPLAHRPSPFPRPGVDPAPPMIGLSRRHKITVIALVVLGIGGTAGAMVAAIQMTHQNTASASVLMLSGPVEDRPVINNAAQPPPAAIAANVLPPMGEWTPARGATIAKRALSWLNWPYSFDGGDASGPTYGMAVDADSRNDASVRGFDCSGLVIYALAPWRGVDHSAAAQYSEVGTFHPRLDSLQPGDLVFWSLDGTVEGIGHVAVYIGDGKVVQAPHSGAYVTVTPIDQVEPGSMGATRPLT